MKKREQLSLFGNQGLVNMHAKIKVLKKESILSFGYGMFLFVGRWDGKEKNNRVRGQKPRKRRDHPSQLCSVYVVGGIEGDSLRSGPTACNIALSVG